MEKLFDQITERLMTDEKRSQSEAELLALREIVFSGMNRCGYFKRFLYLSDFDQRVKNNYYLGFLDSEPKEKINLGLFLPYISDELTAFGIPCETKEIKNGFQINTGDPSENGSNAIIVFIYSDADILPDTDIKYQQIPLPYEIRYADGISANIREQIQDAFEKWLKTAKNSQKNKKGTKKVPNKIKPQEPMPEEKWLQPSLFDF